MKYDNQLIFKSLVGSHAYGLNIESSDEDWKGIYIQSEEDHVCGRYKDLIEITKDECYYEIKRFMELLATANPTILELLFSPEDCIIRTSKSFQLLQEHKGKFLTKVCKDSFAGYAIQQIKKAKGLNKKLNWEGDKIQKKTLYDFIYATEGGKTYQISSWLNDHQLDREKCSLVKLNHFKDCYALYYDVGEMKGIVTDESHDVLLSSVPKGENPIVTIHFNKDLYKEHNKDWNSYQTWLLERNTSRYVEVKNHDQKGKEGQRLDGKNMAHCRRLLDMALEIAQTGNVTIKRPNREELLKIRRGEVDLNTIIEKAEEDISGLDKLYQDSQLPNKVDIEFCRDLILEVRREWKKEFLGKDLLLNMQLGF